MTVFSVEIAEKFHGARRVDVIVIFINGTVSRSLQMRVRTFVHPVIPRMKREATNARSNKFAGIKTIAIKRDHHRGAGLWEVYGSDTVSNTGQVPSLRSKSRNPRQSEISLFP